METEETSSSSGFALIDSKKVHLNRSKIDDSFFIFHLFSYIFVLASLVWSKVRGRNVMISVYSNLIDILSRYPWNLIYNSVSSVTLYKSNDEYIFSIKYIFSKSMITD